MVNAAIEACTIADLGVLVLDELHMLQDDHRGYLLELMATKLLSLEQDTQIIGMSATLSVRQSSQEPKKPPLAPVLTA
jgi:DNA polymerase theta